MTIQRFEGMAVLGPFRDLLNDAVDKAVVIEISNVRKNAEGLTVFDVMRSEATKAGGFWLTCQYEECGKRFEAGRPDAKYHSDNCRLKAFRAAQRQSTLEQIVAACAEPLAEESAVHELAVAEDTPR